jgi:hypothetical protein
MAAHFSTCGSIARVIAITEIRNQGQQRPFYFPQMPAKANYNLMFDQIVQLVNFLPKFNH